MHRLSSEFRDALPSIVSRTDLKNLAQEWYWQDLKRDRPHLKLYEKISPEALLVPGNPGYERWAVPENPRYDGFRIFDYVTTPDELDDLIDRRFLAILPALNEVLQVFFNVADDWRRIEKLMEQRSISRAKSGCSTLLNARTVMADFPLSKRERQFIVDRAEGRVKFRRGRPLKAPGRFALARLWLEVVEEERSIDVANFRVAKFYEVSESFVSKGVHKSVNDGMYPIMRRYLCRCCSNEFEAHFARSLFSEALSFEGKEGFRTRGFSRPLECPQ